MRKIEREMLDALRERKTWIKGNTVVAICPPPSSLASVSLHGNHIATVILTNGEVIVNEKTLAEYPTRTTISRLRALGVDVQVKNFEPYLNGEKL